MDKVNIETGRTDYPVMQVSQTLKGELDIRFMYEMENGELGFTKKGVRVNPEVVSELIDAIHEVMGTGG